ncbi:hypothetical protein JZ751_015340 [Albula glossodonta]|uniref:Uncharacterized protein n=1 Tax=Albula glossodonta TaxID=121402 RepID=A0A8T2MXB3_9TELE|nr:hypothetical protein JZ751_015340 [Albula glossodonta]
MAKKPSPALVLPSGPSPTKRNASTLKRTSHKERRFPARKSEDKLAVLAGVNLIQAILLDWLGAAPAGVEDFAIVHSQLYPNT